MTMLIRLLCVTFVLAGLELLAQETAAPAIQGSASAGKGVPTMQELQATGAGATEDEAFKQAVVDAVRQVVGTLVSAENVINNDRVIKDEVLTLSDGFVEKVLSQDKAKLDDGTWQVKLKCIVRKGQLFGKLQKANVPTIKFDGVSMFADVISQSHFRGDANKMLAKAVREFFRGYPSIYKYECEKPELVHAGDQTTTVKIKYRRKVDEERYYNALLPPLREALKGAAKEVLSITSDKLRKRIVALDPPNHRDWAERAQDLAASRLGFQTIEENDATDLASLDASRLAPQTYSTTYGKIIVQERSSWSVYAIESEILRGCDLRSAFRRHPSSSPFEPQGLVRDATTFILFQRNDSAIPQYIYRIVSSRGNGYGGREVNDIAFNGDCVVAAWASPQRAWANPQRDEDGGMSAITLELPTELLPSIAKITMRLGLNVNDVDPHHSKIDYSGLFDEYPKQLFSSEDWFVDEDSQKRSRYPIRWLKLGRWVSGKINSASSDGPFIYYLGDSLE